MHATKYASPMRRWGFFVLCLGVSLLPLSAFAQTTPDKASNSAGDDEEIAKDGATEINVKNADIAAIVRLFSRKTKRNYILDENVKGKVSIYLPGKVSSDEALRILDSTLAMKGFTSVPVSENLWKIVPSKDAKQSTIPTQTEDNPNPTSAMVTRLVNLKYMNSDDIKQLITPLISAEGLINAYTGTNSLILIDSEDNIKRIVNIINSLDVASSDRDMTIIPVHNADAKDIADKLNEILGSGSGKSDGQDNSLDLLRERIRESAMRFANSNRPAGSNATATGVALSNAANTVAAKAREPKIIPDERTNSIIVVADEDTTARVKALVSQLDSKVDLSGNKFYVYRCQHASAVELADVLAGIAGGNSNGSTPRGALGGANVDDSGTSFGGNGSRNNQSGNRSSSFSSSRGSRNPGQSTLGNQKRTSPGAINLGDNLSITADPATNSLIIIGSKSDYMKILELLTKLDIKRRQVLVEAMLLEVGVDDSLTMGMDWLTSTGGADGGVVASKDGGNIVNVLKDPSKLSGFSVAAASAGSLQLPGFTIPSQSILLQAAQSNTNVNVLSAPTILATDNEPAEIIVGQNVPFVASQATSDTNLNNTFNSIDRQDVGITLRLTPQISSGNSVTLKIFTEVSNLIEATLASNLGPTTTIRTSETTAITKDSQMVVIGGLMSDNVTDSESGVPFFKDIPVFGSLFRDNTNNRRRTNLLIFITPRVVQDQFDARDVTITKRDVLQNEIDADESFPRREEILQNKDIDRVAETAPYEGPKPGTITAPAKKESPSSVPSGNASFSADQNGGEIELKVSPRIPGQPSTKRESMSTASLSGPRDSFIVFQLQAAPEKGSAVPFALTNDGIFGVVVPSDAVSSAHRFFGAGQTYAYQLENKAYPVQAIGTFASSNEAKQLYPSLTESWYTLSPYEIMNLGNGPWLKDSTVSAKSDKKAKSN
ncbi:MAG: type II secretion system secretin GspD [Deltaproteobacteria bacterium]|nr:type II secretion system secretin GspD [Deltaproteobacteria bacterium]